MESRFDGDLCDPVVAVAVEHVVVIVPTRLAVGTCEEGGFSDCNRLQPRFHLHRRWSSRVIRSSGWRSSSTTMAVAEDKR